MIVEKTPGESREDKDKIKQDLAKIIVLGQYGLNTLKPQGGQNANVLLSKTEVHFIKLCPILNYVSTSLDKIPLRELAVILQGIALVYLQ